jgi:ABC-2 type transport system ATP-binding protein
LTAPAAVEVRGLVKRYRDFWGRARVDALRGIDVVIERGTSHGLLGPNGSGKTTTMKVLLGLVRPTEGEAAVLGLPAGALDARARSGFLPEESYLHPFLTGEETLDLTGRLFRLSRGERRRRARRSSSGSAWRARRCGDRSGRTRGAWPGAWGWRRR